MAYSFDGCGVPLWLRGRVSDGLRLWVGGMMPDSSTRFVCVLVLNAAVWFVVMVKVLGGGV